MYPLEEINLSGEAATDFAWYLLELNKNLISSKSLSSERLRINEQTKHEMLPKLFDSFFVQKCSQDFSALFYSKRLSEMSQVIILSCEKEIQQFFVSHNAMLFEAKAAQVFADIEALIGKKIAADKYENDEPVIPPRKLQREHHNLELLGKKLKHKLADKEFAILKRIVLTGNETERLYLAVSKNKNPESASFEKYIAETYRKKLNEQKALRMQYYEKLAIFQIGQAEQSAYARLKKQFPKERKHSAKPIDGQESMFNAD